MTELTVQDIARSERLRAVTDNLFFWQGLRFVALGPLMILVGLVAGMPEAQEDLGTLVVAAGLVVVIVASTLLGRRYRQEFGSVRPIPGAHSTRSRVKWLLVYPAMFGAVAIDMIWPTQLLVSGVVWSAGILLYRHSTGGGRDHYLVLAAALAIMALAPLATGSTSEDALYTMLLILGAGFTVSSLLDHKEMLRVLKGP